MQRHLSRLAPKTILTKIGSAIDLARFSSDHKKTPRLRAGTLSGVFDHCLVKMNDFMSTVKLHLTIK